MSNVIDIMKSFTDFIGANGCTEKEILEASTTLGLTFAEDFHQYLRQIGLASFDGHELTGITKIKRLDVVAVTQRQRVNYNTIPADWYVIEEANIDNIIIWQSSSGAVYQTVSNQNPKRIANNFAEYIQQ